MKIASTSLITALTATSFFVASLGSAQAHDTGYRHMHKYVTPSTHQFYNPRAPHLRPHTKHVAPKRHNNVDKAIILGLFGLAAGAAIAHSANKNKQVQPNHSYQPQYQRNNYYPPAPNSTASYSANGRYAPWSASWYQYCENRYRSFNPTTGTFRGYDGKDHFCVAR